MFKTMNNLTIEAVTQALYGFFQVSVDEDTLYRVYKHGDKLKLVCVSRGLEFITEHGQALALPLSQWEDFGESQALALRIIDAHYGSEFLLQLEKAFDSDYHRAAAAGAKAVESPVYTIYGMPDLLKHGKIAISIEHTGDCYTW